MPNYWTWKEKDMMELLSERGVTIEEKNRKSMVEALMKYDLENGLIEEPIEETDEGIKAADWIDPETKEKWKLRKIIFHDANPNDPNYVFIGHNGKSFYFPKDKEIMIPQIFLDSVIKDAVEHRLEMLGSGRNVQFRVKKVHRIPYSIVQ